MVVEILNKSVAAETTDRPPVSRRGDLGRVTGRMGDLPGRLPRLRVVVLACLVIRSAKDLILERGMEISGPSSTTLPFE